MRTFLANFVAQTIQLRIASMENLEVLLELFKGSLLSFEL